MEKPVYNKIKHGDYNLELELGIYHNGQVCLRLRDMEDKMPYATATVCVENDLLQKGEVAIKDYSENEGILNALIEADIVEPPHAFIQADYTKIPICKLIINV